LGIARPFYDLSPTAVIPAKAGIHPDALLQPLTSWRIIRMDPGLRRGDAVGVAKDEAKPSAPLEGGATDTEPRARPHHPLAAVLHLCSNAKAMGWPQLSFGV